jgi:hypothetical protein
MNEAINNLVKNINEDYYRWTLACAKGELSDHNKEMIENFAEGIEIVEGRKYVKVIQNRSAWGFIVATDDDKKFKKGDILMAAGWAKPARNKARGNIFEEYSIAWTGPHYLI